MQIQTLKNSVKNNLFLGFIPTSLKTKEIINEAQKTKIIYFVIFTVQYVSKASRSFIDMQFAIILYLFHVVVTLKHLKINVSSAIFNLYKDGFLSSYFNQKPFLAKDFGLIR